ncbi:MAG: hypothetical protein U0271_01735 [Polyangiaceae bacterium]
MTSVGVLDALRRQDAEAMARARPFAAEVAALIEPELEQLDTRGRLLATVVLREIARETRRAGALLLTMTGDAEDIVANEAARALLKLPLAALPPAADVVYASAVRLSVDVRGQLYRLVGKLGDKSVLGELRRVAGQETSPEARRKLDSAAIALGAREEWRELFDRIQAMQPDTAEEVFEDVVDARDRGLLRAMLPWLADDRVVNVVGTHELEFAVRVCDLAAIAASRLGVLAGPQLPYRPVTDTVLADTRAALAALEEPRPPVLPLPGSGPLAVPQAAPAPRPLTVLSSVPSPAAPRPPAVSPPAPPPPPLPPPPPPLAPTRREAPAAMVPPAQAAAPQTTAPLLPQATLAAVLPFLPTLPFARRGAQPEQRRLSYEQFLWACASLAARPDSKIAVLSQLAIPGESAWTLIHSTWLDWLRADPDRWAKWSADLERSRAELGR